MQKMDSLSLKSNIIFIQNYVKSSQKKKKKNLGTSIQNQYFIIILIQNEAYLRKFKFKTLKLRSSTVIAHEISASYTYGKRSFLPLV